MIEGGGELKILDRIRSKNLKFLKLNKEHKMRENRNQDGSGVTEKPAYNLKQGLYLVVYH